MDMEFNYIDESEDVVPKFKVCINPEINDINKEISEIKDEIKIIEKNLNEAKLFFKNAKECKTIEFTSILGVMASFLTFMGTYNIAIDNSSSIAILVLSLFSGIAVTFVPAIGALTLCPKKTEQFLIKHFKYIANVKNNIQQLSKELEEKEDYILKLNIKLESLVTGKEVLDIESEKQKVYEYRKLFCEKLTLTNLNDEKENKSVKRRVRTPKNK